MRLLWGGRAKSLLWMRGWLETLRSSFTTFPQGRLEDVLETVGVLHKAGVSFALGSLSFRRLVVLHWRNDADSEYH